MRLYLGVSMVRPSFLAILALSACVVSGPVPDTDAPTTTTTGSTTTTTAPPLYNDQGSISVLVRHPDVVTPNSRVLVSGVFAEDRRGYKNLAQCLASQSTWCMADLPTVEDDYVLVDAYTDAVSDNLRSIDVGPTMQFGNYTVPRQEIGGHTLYFEPDLLADGLPSGAQDLSFSGGDWGDFSGTAIDSTPGTLVVTSPDPLRDSGHVAGAPVEVRWNGGNGNGEVYLAVLTPTERRLYLLADDGEFDLDLSTLPVADGEQLDLVLGRWTVNTLNQDGNDIHVEIHDEQWMYGSYRDLNGRTEIIPENTCATAIAMPALVSGTYFGDVSSFNNSSNPGNNGCTGFSATGQDGILRVELPDQSQLEATLGFISDDASMYLLTACGNTGTCIDGADATVGANSQETVSYFNNTGIDQQLFLVIDSFGTNSDLFLLDVTQTTLQTNLLVDTCADALAMQFTPNGVYQGDLSLHQNFLDPTCAPAAGPDGLAKFELQSGETLNASVTIAGANPVLYVLYNCAIGDSCAAGADFAAGPNESLIYTNTTAASEIVYLGVDSDGISGAYTLDVLVQ